MATGSHLEFELKIWIWYQKWTQKVKVIRKTCAVFSFWAKIHLILTIINFPRWRLAAIFDFQNNFFIMLKPFFDPLWYFKVKKVFMACFVLWKNEMPNFYFLFWELKMATGSHFEFYSKVEFDSRNGFMRSIPFGKHMLF